MTANSFIGPVPIAYVDQYALSGHEATVGGWFLTAGDREELRELCVDAHCAVIHELLGGGVLVEDTSENHMLVQYCIFTENQFYTGFYIITQWNYAPQVGWPNYYPWNLNMVFIGTRGEVLESFDVGYMREVPNDWE